MRVCLEPRKKVDRTDLAHPRETYVNLQGVTDTEWKNPSVHDHQQHDAFHAHIRAMSLICPLKGITSPQAKML